MRFTPENFQIVEGHEPAASNGLADTSDAICLRGANGVLILVHEDYAVDANSLVLTVHEGATAAEAAAGTYPLTSGSEFQIWVNLTAESADTWTRQTDGLTYTINGAAGNNVMVAFYVSASCLTNGRDWVHLGSTDGDAGNIVSVIYVLDGLRYQQSAPPTAIV